MPLEWIQVVRYRRVAGGSRIGVQTVQGIVHLTGIVETAAMQENAAEIARQG